MEISWTNLVINEGILHIKRGEGPSNTTVVILNIQCDIVATCFDSTESSSGPRVLDLYSTTHCGIPNAYNNRSKVQKI
jgi:hypothetical protein